MYGSFLSILSSQEYFLFSYFTMHSLPYNNLVACYTDDTASVMGPQ